MATVAATGADETQRLSEWLRRIAVGDCGNFADLYRATAGRVYGMAVRVLRDGSHAEEITQEVFLEVWNKADTFDPLRGSPLAWLLTLAHRRAIDRVRSEQSRTDRESLAARLDHRRDYDDPVVCTVISRMSSDAFENRLDELTALQRQALVATYYDGFTQHETARLLGVGLPAIKARKRDALLKLKRLIESENETSQTLERLLPS
ncbi:sigma-70 family RNA polymerase sigma factor [Antrihabitans spumae]|jgi:RNA polymerase sigma-70 factor, ECF subfamily|uniref:Sigma-70 family RNA polymerase sigma factor n=1 Tax=Antrihabitans spumae TaxID=3373370 RepID=A0ABW7KKY7_9NOCA